MQNLILFCRSLFCDWIKSPQLFHTILLTVILCVATVSDLRAEITWNETATEFNYSIDIQSTFYYAQNQYLGEYTDNPIKNEASWPYNSVAEIEHYEFEDIPEPGSGVLLQAQAMGPENGIDPPNGLKVQAFLSTVAEGLNDQQGVDIDLEAVSRVIRRFEVNKQENYTVRMELTGLTDYDEFYTNDQYRAEYSIQTEVRMEQIVGTGDQMVVQTVPGFPVNLDESNRRELVAVQLRPYDDQLRAITYRIKTELKLNSRIDNLTFQSLLVSGDVNGNYQLGSPQAPFALTATLKPGIVNSNAGVILLLLSD